MPADGWIVKVDVLLTTVLVCALLAAWRITAVYRSWQVGRLIPPLLLLVYSFFIVFGATAMPRFARIEAHRNGATGSFLDGVMFGSAALAPYGLSLLVCVLSFFLMTIFPSGRSR